jgi:hypothetical protein
MELNKKTASVDFDPVEEVTYMSKFQPKNIGRDNIYVTLSSLIKYLEMIQEKELPIIFNI